MIEQFVTYEIALKLKELGFDEECFAIFFKGILNNGRTVNYISDDWQSSFYKNKINSESNSIDIVSAPLWQQVVDWFREKYLLHIEIQSPDYSDDVNFSWNIHKICEFGSLASGESFDYYKVREQAILKAIELCKR